MRYYRLQKSLRRARKHESLGLGLSEKRTSIEVTATRQQTRATGIKTRWVNSDRQLADVLTKPTAPASSIQRLQQTGRWKIVWDANYTSAKNLRKEKREKHFKNENKNADNPDSAVRQGPGLPSGPSVDNAETADAATTVVDVIESSKQPAAIFQTSK